MRLVYRYWFQRMEETHSHSLWRELSQNQVKLYIITALHSALAALLQAAGGFLPGIGYLISPFATLPIAIVTMISWKAGVLAFALTNLLLLMIQPSEIIIFLFTTGLLGLGLGTSFVYIKRRLFVTLFSGLILFGGIATVLYLLQFPILGPVATSFTLSGALTIVLFTTLYSFIWVELLSWFMRRVGRMRTT